MNFIEALSTYNIILENGPLGTRLQYDYGFKLGLNMATFDLIEQKLGREALTEIYQGDINVAQRYHVPIIINAATFRASKNHLRSRGFHEPHDVKRINMKCIDFIKTIRNSYSYEHPKAPIFIAAPLGSMYDAYGGDAVPDVDTARLYHQEQMDIFKKVTVDFVNIVTLLSLSEAMGIAIAAERSKVDYTIGFILNEHGTLVDGTPLHEAIHTIDEKTTKKPLGYLITCTHSSTLSKLMDSHDEYKRLIGVQANGSSLSLKKLAAMEKPVADSPEQFTEEIMRLKKRFNLKIIGGYCGTSREHLQAIAAACKPELNP